MVWLLYYMVMYLMVGGIRIASLWNAKSRQWIAGRVDWNASLQKIATKKGNRVWFHVSSLGEFEQARPVMERLSDQQPLTEIILTFYSPSGYSVRHDYRIAKVFYLPADLPGNAKKWLTMINPDLAVFVKYDLWPGYLQALQDKSIPSMLISAHWTPGGWFHSWSLPPSRALLKKFKIIFLQQKENLHYFKLKGFDNLLAAGDTRIDRCLDLPSEAKDRIPILLKEEGPFDLIAGSTWPEDEKIILEVLEKLDLKILLAPHDVSENNIKRLEKSCHFPVIRLSELKSVGVKPKIIIVDNIGLLSVLYSLGKIAYIGGGFGSGIHNTLEPMAHGKPILFGPAYKKFPEAVEMVQQNGAWPISNGSDLERVITQLQLPGAAEKAGRIALDYLHKNSGASTTVTKYIIESIPYSVVK